MSLLGVAAVEAHAAQVALSWQDNSNNEAGFTLERATGSGAFASIATTAANVASYLDTAVASSTTYSYRVYAFNNAANSTPSNVATVTTPSAGANTPPTIANLSHRTINEDTGTGAVAFTVGDAETAAASLSVSGTSSNTTLVPNASLIFGGSGANRTVTVTPAAGQSGTATITVTVSDGALTASDTFILTVNAVANTAPTISNIANQSVNEDTATGALAFTVGDTQTSAASLTLSASSSNTALVPNAAIILGGSGANRTVGVTPAANLSGTATITVTVSDGTLTASDPFTVTVNAINDAPTIAHVADQSISEDTSTGALAFTIGDVETAATSLTVSSSSSNPTLVPHAAITLGGAGANRTVTITPAANQSGSATITLTVSDGTATASDAMVLTVTAVNDAPAISPIADQSINENGATPALAFLIGDAETTAASLTVSGSSSNPALVPPAGITFGGTGANRTITLTPAANQNGAATITVSVSDGTASTGTTFNLAIAAVNDAPTITSIASQTIAQGVATSALAFTVGDSETAAAGLTVSGASSNPTLVPDAAIVFGGTGANRTVTITPVAVQSGSSWITITVSDGAATRADTFLLTVRSVAPVNQPPTITAIPDQNGNADGSIGPLAFTIADSESAASDLTVSATSSNPALVPVSGITLGGSGANRSITITPAAGQSGAATITVSVSDGTNVTSAMFIVTIAAAPPPAARLLNLSTRVVCRPDQEALIPGFVIHGTASKRVLLRAIGPTLGMEPFNVPGALPDPRVFLRRWNGAAFVDVASNDNWGTNANVTEIRQVSASLLAFAIPDNSRDAALLLDLAPGQYTIISEDVSGGNGVVILELYDVDASPNGSRIINMSNRGFVGTGAEVMISGFVVSDEGPKMLLVRAVGPGLAVAPFHVPDTISDPLVEVYRRNHDGSDTLIVTSDNWGEHGDAAAIAQVAAQVAAFPLPDESKDVAFAATFAPGVYTAVVRGVNGATGTVLIEVYTVE